MLKKDFSDIEIFFHVGIERTGTKYLQNSIFPDYKNIHYLNKNKYKKAKEIIFKRRHKRYLVSMELNMSQQFEDEVKDFSSLFPNAKTIMVIRPQHSFLASHYKRRVKNGENISFKDLIDVNGNKSIYKVSDLCFMDKIRILEKHFKPKPLFLLYGDLRNDPIAYLKSIADYVGVSFDADQVDLKRRHTSYNENQLKAIQRTMKFINIERKKPTQNLILNFIYRLYVDAIRYSVLYTAKMLPDSYFRKEEFLDPNQLKEIKDFYSNDWKETVEYVKASR